MLVSLVTSVRDGSAHLPACIDGVLAQTHAPLEWLVYDDGSSDDSVALLEAARERLAASRCRLVLLGSPAGSPARGCGYGRNRAIERASSDSALLVVQDADDVSAPSRCELLLAASRAQPDGALLGSRYSRDGCGRPRDMAWHNGMSVEQLTHQRLRETTLAIPTWAFSSAAWRAVGGFAEDAPNNAEDLLFFYAHLARGGALYRAEQPLVMYRHSADGVCATRAVPAALIFAIRMAELERVLATPPWCHGFSIWNAGKEGKKVFRALSHVAKNAVRAFADVDPRKVQRGCFDDGALTRRRVPIVHFSRAVPPLLLCVKAMGLAGEGEGSFEHNLASLALEEGVQYLHFS